MRRSARRHRWAVAAALACITASAPAAAQDAAAAPAEARPVVDRAGALGLPRSTHSFDIAVGRLDGDRRPDLVISYHSRIVAYLNRPQGLVRVFEKTRGDPHGCAIADVDGNGLGDFYCTRGVSLGTRENDNLLALQVTPQHFVQRAVAWGVADPLGRGRRTTFLDLNRDGRPDLLVGNEYDRADGRRAPTRTFVNVDGQRFAEVRVGLTGERGALCVDARDQNGDGRVDVLLCGGHGPATINPPNPQNRLFLYRSVRGQRFREVARALGVADADVQSARLARLNGDRLVDLVAVSPTAVAVRPGRADGSFGPIAFGMPLTAGQWVAVGDIDGRRGPDLLVVQRCREI